jgi:hypothetical protein
MNNGTNEGNFLLEVDGVAVFQASEIKIGGIKQEPYKIFSGQRRNPQLGLGKYECDEVEIKQALRLNNEASEVGRLFTDYIKGNSTQKVSIRVVTLDEDGRSEVGYDEFVDCVPTVFKPSEKNGEGKNAAYFSISFKPEDWIPNF